MHRLINVLEVMPKFVCPSLQYTVYPPFHVSLLASIALAYHILGFGKQLESIERLLRAELASAQEAAAAAAGHAKQYQALAESSDEALRAMQVIRFAVPMVLHSMSHGAYLPDEWHNNSLARLGQGIQDILGLYFIFEHILSWLHLHTHLSWLCATPSVIVE